MDEAPITAGSGCAMNFYRRTGKHKGRGPMLFVVFRHQNVSVMSGVELPLKAKALRPGVPVNMIHRLWRRGDETQGFGERC
jgi:hypothetical protein